MAFGNLDGSGDDNQDLAEINIIPLVDVMLVLLIIFMVAAPLSITGIKVNLPTSAAKGSHVDEGRVILSISSKGDYYLEKTKIENKNLTSKLSAVFENRNKKQLFIRADRGVKYGRVVDAMSSAKLAGVSKMSMLTVPPK
jgi:biopolymer transport protein TolR